MGEAPVARGNDRFVRLVAGMGALAGLLFGYGTGVIAGALLFVRDHFGLSPFAQGVVVSAMLLGAAGGATVAGRVGERFGRRSSVVIAAIVFVVGALVCALAPTTAVLVIGRVVAGVGVGMASTSAPVYISEVSPQRLRGALLTMFQLAVTVGILASFLVALVLEPGAHWRAMFAISAIPGVILAIGMYLVPPSPRWLVERGRVEEASAVLVHLRGEGVDVEIEMVEIRTAAAHPTGSWHELLQPGIRLALIVGVGLAILQQITGINAVLYYAPTIFRSAGLESESSAILAGAGLGLVNVVFTVVAIRLIDRLGRRTLLLAGSVGMIVGLFALGLSFALPHLSSTTSATIAIAGTAFYLAAFAVSLGPIVWVLNAEIYPLSVRSLANGTASLAHWVANFLVVLTFLPLIHLIGSAAMYWIYAGITLAGIGFIAAYVPETRDRSLESIEEYWRDRASPAGAAR
jgi:MFS transporter, SP family, galactose:H+ symporter